MLCDTVLNKEECGGFVNAANSAPFRGVGLRRVLREAGKEGPV